MRLLPLAALLGCLAVPAGAAVAAEACPQPGSEITTDRPDVTNSSLVVPKGSFQQENGINIAGRDGGQVLDGTNTRLRFGIAQCLEFLVDVPTYFNVLSGTADTGFTGKRRWQTAAATLDAGGPGDRVRVAAALPAGTRAFFFNLDAGGLTLSSEFTETARNNLESGAGIGSNRQSVRPPQVQSMP